MSYLLQELWAGGEARHTAAEQEASRDALW